MAFFVWTKMQSEGGQSLSAILALKEAERLAGGGIFWWGVGNSLGTAVKEAAKSARGTLPILFSMMRATPQRKDVNPGQVHLWTTWADATGAVHNVPAHVLEWSRGADNKKTHYALVCRAPTPLVIGDHGPFDPSRCRTHLGNPPGASQVTALLQGDLGEDHSPGTYHFGFRATLIEPWTVQLVNPRSLSSAERGLFASWKRGDNWRGFVAQFRGAEGGGPVS